MPKQRRHIPRQMSHASRVNQDFVKLLVEKTIAEYKRSQQPMGVPFSPVHVNGPIIPPAIQPAAAIEHGSHSIMSDSQEDLCPSNDGMFPVRCPTPAGSVKTEPALQWVNQQVQAIVHQPEIADDEENHRDN